MAVTKIKPIKSTLSKALDYIQNPDKTDGKMLVSSFGCSYETADIEFEYTLSQARQKGNNLAFHLIQSFEPGEVDCEKAHTIGKQLADAVTKGRLSSAVWTLTCVSLRTVHGTTMPSSPLYGQTNGQRVIIFLIFPPSVSAMNLRGSTRRNRISGCA